MGTDAVSGTTPNEKSEGNVEISQTSQQIEKGLEKRALRNSQALNDLRKLHPWPEEEPDVRHDWSGWFSRNHKNLFSRIISESTEVVVELGSWLGKSSRFIAQKLSDNGTIICVDHWKGSPEFGNDPKLSGKVPTAYETFVKNQWGLKDKTIMIRDSTMDGLRSIQMCGVIPDIVYIDAGHDYDNVSADIAKCIEIFPNAMLVMDDYQPRWPDVVRAVDEAAEANKDYYKIPLRKLCVLSKDKA